MVKEKKLFIDCKAFNSLPKDYQKFVLEYLKDYNGTRAYQSVYKCTKKSAATSAPRLMFRNVGIQQALSECSEIINQGEVADANELRLFWTKILRGSITDICSWNENSGLLFVEESKDIDRDKARLVKKVKVTEKSDAKGDWTEVKTEVELHDPLKASELLGRSLGIFIDKTELSGKVGGPIVFRVVYDDKPKDGDDS